MIAIKYKHIRTVQHNIGNGTTEPKFAVTDDDTQVIIKTFNGPQGNLVLFNEYFCYRLAILLDIKMPISGICYIDGSTKIYNDDMGNHNEGFGFYSTYLNKVAPLIQTIVPFIQNKEDFYKILLFDHLIYNTDRNAGNLLVQYYKSNITLQVIDHTHVFINQTFWDANCLIRGMEDKDYHSTKIMEYNDYLYRMIMQVVPFKLDIAINYIPLFEKCITIKNMEQIINDIPDIWKPMDISLKTLIEYLQYRVSHLEDICITIRNYLNK